MGHNKNGGCDQDFIFIWFDRGSQVTKLIVVAARGCNHLYVDSKVEPLGPTLSVLIE